MGLFKSREQRRIDRDIEIRKGISQIKRHIRSLEKNEKDYLKKARRARQLGSDQQLSFLKATLKKTAAQKRLMERQLLNIETALQIKNQAEAHGQFAKSINAVSGAIAEAFGSTDLAKTQAEFARAMAQAQSMEERMEIFLDLANETMLGEATSAEELVTDEEIDSLIEAEVAQSEGEGIDKAISKGLKEIEKELGKE
jgi:hypothetical protein